MGSLPTYALDRTGNFVVQSLLSRPRSLEQRQAAVAAVRPLLRPLLDKVHWCSPPCRPPPHTHQFAFDASLPMLVSRLFAPPHHRRCCSCSSCCGVAEVRSLLLVPWSLLPLLLQQLHQSIGCPVGCIGTLNTVLHHPHSPPRAPCLPATAFPCVPSGLPRRGAAAGGVRGWRGQSGPAARRHHGRDDGGSCRWGPQGGWRRRRQRWWAVGGTLASGLPGRQ
jgi:hypothetical protein